MLGSQLNSAFGNEFLVLAILGDLDAAVSAAGTNQSTATSLTASISIVTTVGAGTGVVLPTLSKKDRLHVANHGANTLAVFPPSGGKLSNNSANVPAFLAVGKSADFVCTATVNYSVLLGA